VSAPTEVMIVDDEPDILELMKALVDMSGGHATVHYEARNGEEALRLLEHCAPEVVVLDQVMPGLTGLETAARIRDEKPETVVILCSAYVTGPLLVEAKQAGIALCLSKNNITRLPEEIRSLVHAA